MKENYLIKISQILAIIGIAFMASISLSCSTDDITDSDSVPLISGVAVDGYIYGARVYLDCDKDFTYDSDEVLTYTDKNGKFSFVSNTENTKKIEECPIVVDATDIEYVFDSDHKEADTDNWPSLKDVGREGFKISSPVGEYKVVSPLTMIVHTIDPNDDAKIQNQLGITANDLNTMGLQNIRELLHLDYFSTNDITDSDQIKVLEKIAKAGRLLARVLEVKQSPTNSDANTCIGQKCPELMKEALAHFNDIYNEQGVFNEKGVPISDYHDLYEDIEDRENGGGGETFNTRFDGDKIDLDEFANAAIFQQNTGNPCTAEGTPSTDFEFMISFTSTFSGNTNEIAVVMSQFPNAEMIYQSYQNSSSSTDSPLNCVNFFRNRGDKKSKSAKATAFTRFISTDAYVYMSNAELSTLYQGFYHKNVLSNDVSLTRFYMKECGPDDICFFPRDGKNWSIVEAINDDSKKIKTVKFNIDTMDTTVETSTVKVAGGAKTLEPSKDFIILDRKILKQVKDSLVQILSSVPVPDGNGGHGPIPDGSGGHQ